MYCHDQDSNIGYAEYTVEDVIVFKYDMGSCGLEKLVDALSYVRDYYHKPISTVGLFAHGLETGCYIGEWIDTANYTNYQALFERWSTYMSADGQILSYHCLVGNAVTMLNQIASWTGCEIYAHDHVGWTGVIHLSNDPLAFGFVWNHNMRNVRWRRDEAGTLDPGFEYMSNPMIAARIILEEREW